MLPDSLGQLAALCILDVGDIQLIALPDSFGYLLALEDLYLDLFIFTLLLPIPTVPSPTNGPPEDAATLTNTKREAFPPSSCMALKAAIQSGGQSSGSFSSPLSEIMHSFEPQACSPKASSMRWGADWNQYTFSASFSSLQTTAYKVLPWYGNLYARSSDKLPELDVMGTWTAQVPTVPLRSREALDSSGVASAGIKAWFQQMRTAS